MGGQYITCMTQDAGVFPCTYKQTDQVPLGTAVFLFAIFCAYWAQTTRRNAWLWFFLGFFFAPITGLVLLYKNSKDRDLQSS